MARVFYIEASPSKTLSQSIRVAKEFFQAYREKHPQDRIETIDLWQADLPPFDAQTIDAKFAVLRNQKFTPEQQAKWEAVRAISRRFNAADKYVFSVPMWNFSIPYRLKHYIDVVTLAGENWSCPGRKGTGAYCQERRRCSFMAAPGNMDRAMVRTFKSRTCVGGLISST
jgi:FMN-dependent NADH-azoreductase